MPLADPKKKAKKEKKVKLPAYWTEPIDMEPFWNLKGNDLIMTPTGLVATVLGVKYPTKQRDIDAERKLCIEYKGFGGGVKSIAEKDIEGYIRCHEADHIWRVIAEYHVKADERDEEFALVKVLNDMYRAELEAKAKGKKKNKPPPPL